MKHTDDEQFASAFDVEMASLTFATKVKGMVVSDQESYTAAAALLSEARLLYDKAEAYHEAKIKPAREEWQNLNAEKKAVLDPLTAAIQNMKAEIVSFDHEQQRLRREEQNRIEAERRELEEAERVRLAEQLKSQGVGEDEAIEIASSAPVSVPARTAPTYEKASGISLRHNWKASVTDFKKLVQFVAKNPMYLNLLQPNESNINSQARALKEQLTIPGLRVYGDVGASVRK